MELSNKKRVRSTNWEEEEKRLLRQLVIEKIDILENKDTSTNTNNMKKAAWQEVLSCFNSLNNKKRDLTQIMTQWRNTKGKVKSRDSEYRRAQLMTGGGPPPPSPPAEDLAIIQAIPNEFVIDSNCFDSDSLMTSFSQSQTSGTPLLITDCNEPKTPLPSSSNVMNDEIEVVQIIEDIEEPAAKLLVATPVSKSKPVDNLRKRFRPEHLKHKKINTRTNEDYEQELFLLTKRSKERDNERAEEIHMKRMAILNLEYEYWKKKLNSA